MIYFSWPLSYPPFHEADAAGEFRPRISVRFKGIEAVPECPSLRAGGDAHEFADGVRVVDRGGEFDEPGIRREVVGHGVSVWGVVDFVGEEENLRCVEDEAVGHVPSEEGFEGFGGVFVMPVAGAFPEEHFKI
jgi:hypothetical protein